MKNSRVRASSCLPVASFDGQFGSLLDAQFASACIPKQSSELSSGGKQEI